MIAQEDYLLLSGIQSFTFCRRQWALVHIEGLWAENTRTLEGEYMHERVHDPAMDGRRGDVIVSRGMAICSRSLGVSGACDVVEFRPDPNGIALFGHPGTYRPLPVEYKHGREKQDDCDRLQLCAQAMCLEEMLLTSIPEGCLYYAETRRRENVQLTDALRDRVTNTFREMHELMLRQHTPKPRRTKSCNACSLKDICIPGLGKAPNVSEYIAGHLRMEEQNS